MVIKLDTLCGLHVANIITKMDPISFRSACLSSKYINTITTKYKKYIRFRLPDHEIELLETWNEEMRAKGDNILFIVVGKREGSCHEYYCQPNEIMTKRPELAFFIFDYLHLYHKASNVILEELKKENVRCCRLFIEERKFVNQAVRILRPTELFTSCNGDCEVVPSEMMEDELLSRLNLVDIYVDKEQQMANCLENMVYHVPSLKICAGSETLRNVEPTLKLVKNLVEKIRYSSSSTVNESFFLYTNIPSSVNLKDLIRPFRELPHSSWTTYAKFGESPNSFAFLFISTAHQTTLVLFLEEEILSARGKGLTISYIVARSMDQFLMFYAKCRHLRAPIDVEKVFSSRKKKLQFNFVKKEYFSVN